MVSMLFHNNASPNLLSTQLHFNRMKEIQDNKVKEAIGIVMFRLYF